MKIRINESQYKLITEAMLPGFRLDYLKSCGSFQKRVKYCKEMLGSPIGNGSSRIVFQIDDEVCLKLAKNEKGVAQNLEEISIARDNIISYIPKIFNGSDEENGLWVITQYVLPAKPNDFKKILGADFKDVSDFASNIDRSYNRRDSYLMKMADNMIRHLYDKYENNDLVIELFNDIHELKGSYSQFVGDLTRIQNWGMVKEDGNVFLVILDSGLSEEVFNQFYRRKI